MRKNNNRIKIAISVTALAIALVHIVWPNFKVDGVLLILIVISIIPWLRPLLKSVELPGGLKFEFQDLENVEDEAKKIGLIKETDSKENNVDYPFLIVAETDPNLALAGLRIEIEKRLRKLAEQNNIRTSRKGLTDLINELCENHALTENERTTLQDMISTLNQAVHGHAFDLRVGNWVIENGPRILDSLDGKVDVEARSSKFDYNMARWGLEKSEHVLQKAAGMIDLTKNELSSNPRLQEEIYSILYPLIWDSTKLYSFFCGADWETRDRQLIVNEGSKGFEKLKKRYNREFQQHKNPANNTSS